MTKLSLAGQTHDVVRLGAPAGGLRIDGVNHAAAIRNLGDGTAVVTVDGRAHRVRVAAAGGRVWVHAGGRAWTVEREEPLGAASGPASGSDAMLASMPGTVIAVAAEAGTQVSAGATVLVIESMKLETAVAAPRDGVIAEIVHPVGASFDKGAVLARMAPEQEKGGAAD